MYDPCVARRRSRGDPIRIAAAGLQGIAQRHVLGFTSYRDTASALQDALASDEPSGPELDAALAELRQSSTDPQALIQAASHYVDIADPSDVLVLRLFELAGADIATARAWRQTHPPGGFNPPQAPPATPGR